MYDVVILGAGPAGAVTALNLAPFRRVLLVDRRRVPEPHIGESLPGAARRLLRDMGLWDGFAADHHAPCHAYRGAWGGVAPVERDALGDPDGHGWHLDRARFERRLRATAVARGAHLLAPARATRVTRDESGWRIDLEDGHEAFHTRAALVVDASGRASRALAGHGARRLVGQRLVCGWAQAGRVDLPAGLTQIEAEVDGWWYAAPQPGGGGLLAFHTDADLPAARAGRSVASLLERARSLPMLGRLVAGSGWDEARGGYCAAYGARLERPVGDGWVAVGDAALAFDPLSSQGLFNALYTGLAAAETADRWLGGAHASLDEYADELAAVWQAYEAHLEAWYAMEQRWPGSPFWARRRGRERGRGGARAPTPGCDERVGSPGVHGSNAP